MTTKICEACKTNGYGEISITSFTSKANKEYWKNPDGSFHTTPVNRQDGKTKWIHVDSKEMLEFVAKNGYRPQQSQLSQTSTQPETSKEPYKYIILNDDEVAKVKEDMLRLVEIRHIAKEINDATSDKGNGAAVGNLVNSYVALKTGILFSK